MDTNQDIITNKAPPILDIKPIEELNEQLDEQLDLNKQKVHVPEPTSPQKKERPNIDSQDIFVKPNKLKPKRVSSEKQKAHMKKLRELKLQKKNRQKQEKMSLKEENERMKREMELLKKQHNLENIRTTKPPLIPKTKPERETNNDGNDEMARFMKYMDMYEKHKQAKQSKQPKQPKPQPKPVPKPTPKKNNSSYYVDFLTPQVRYNNYDNPFG